MAISENTTTLPAPSRRKPNAKPTPSLVYQSPDSLPDRYTARVFGDCMDPVYPEGSIILIDKTLPCRAGDDVAIFLTKNGKAPYDAAVKRLVMKTGPKSNIAPTVLVEMLNPPTMIQYRPENIVAIHRVVGLASAEECQG